MNVYTSYEHMLAKRRMDDLLEEAAHDRLAKEARAVSLQHSSLRYRLGTGLMRLGERLLGEPRAALS
jgi:hypothetical protein